MSQSAPPPSRLFSGTNQVNPKQTFPVMDLVGGLYRRKNPVLVRPNQWFLLQNWVPHQGMLRKIGGFQVYGVPQVDPMYVRGLYEFVYYDQGSEIRKLLINAGGKLYSRPLPVIFSTTFFSDDFNRANGLLGTDWIDPAISINGLNAFAIDTNQAECQGSALVDGGRASAWYYDEIDSIDYDAQVDAKFTVDSSPYINRWAALITKVKDRDNNYRFEVSPLGARLFRRLNGKDTLLATSVIDTQVLFGDGFEDYTVDSELPSPWVIKAATDNPLVRDDTPGPDGSLATLQIEDVAKAGGAARDVSTKWVPTTGTNPLKIRFYVKQTVQAAVTTNLFGVLMDSAWVGAAAKLLLRLNSSHQFECQYWTGGADAWLNTGKLCELGQWYKIEIDLFAKHFALKINGNASGTGSIPGPTDLHDMDHLYWPANAHATAKTFIDCVWVSGTDFVGEASDTVLYTEDFEDYADGNDLADYVPPWAAMYHSTTHPHTHASYGANAIKVSNDVDHTTGAGTLCSARPYGPNDGYGVLNNYASLECVRILGTDNYIDLEFWVYADAVADSTDASKYALAQFYASRESNANEAGSSCFSIYTTRVNTEAIKMWTHIPGSPWNADGYTLIGEFTPTTWRKIVFRMYRLKLEVYLDGALVQTSTAPNAAAYFHALWFFRLSRCNGPAQSIYVDDFKVTVNGAPTGTSGQTEGTAYTLKTSHRGYNIICELNGVEVLRYRDENSPLLKAKFAGIQGYVDSTFDNFSISTPAADTLIADGIPEGFYDYATIMNNAIICVNDGKFGLSTPYRFDGTNLYSLELAAPLAAPTAGAPAAGGAITEGDHYWAYSFIDDMGNESNVSAVSATQTVVALSGNYTVNLSGILVSPNGSVVARRIYRTSADGGTLMWLADISDNTTTTYADVLPDSSLSTEVAPEDNDPAPTAGFCVAHQGRLYLTGDPDEPDMVRPSYVGEICAFPLSLELPFQRNMGDRNTGLHVYGEKVHVFKTSMVGYITDTDPEFWAISILSNMHGSVSERANAIVGNALVFPSKGQISALVGNRVINLSREIDGLLDEMDPAERWYAHAVNNVAKKRYEYYYRTPGVTWPNRAIFMHYDESLSSDEDASRVWSGPHTIGFTCSEDIETEKGDPVIVAGSTGKDGTVYMLDIGLSFLDKAQVSIATGPQTYFQQPDVEKRLRGIYLYWNAVAGSKIIYIQIDRDFLYYPVKTYYTLQPVMSPKNRVPLGGTCRFACATFYHDTLDEDIELYGYSWVYQVLGLRP